MKNVTVVIACLATIAGCAGAQKVPSAAERDAAARQAVAEVQAGNFDQASKSARAVLAKDQGNPQARLASAIARYQEVMHHFYRDMTSLVGGAFVGRTLNHRLLKWSLEQTERGIGEVERDLAVASEDPSVALKLCLACWERDWNHNGRIDERDGRLLQIEMDANGERIPEGDPRRKPTFRFDRGDVFWARAMICFQRAAFNLVLAYKLPEMSELIDATRESTIKVAMVDKARVHKARDLILTGLEHADRARREYLQETDDVGEWVPNPRQKNHPLPLPVDETLYQIWEGVLRDLRALIKGEQGISVAEVAQLGDHQWKNPPGGFIDVAKLLDEPADIVIRVENLERDWSKENAQRVLKDIFGEKYTPRMEPTPLIARLTRMKREIERGKESLERKLRYLLWLN